MTPRRCTLPLASAWAAIALLLAACGGGGSSSGAVPTGTQVAPGTWTVIGSSTPAGVGATSGHGWVDLMRNAYSGHGATVVNLAVGGSVSYQGVPTATSPPPGRPAPDPSPNIDAALARSPKLVFVSYPSNDTAAGYTADETVGNVLAMRNAAAANGVAVIVTSTQPSRAAPTAQQAVTLADIDRRLAAEFGGCFVNVRAVLATSSNTLDPRYDSGDGQHLNDAGHAVVFDQVRTVLESGQCVRV
jgi:lysophospholipase L1-like esterase